MTDEELTELATKAFGIDEYESQFWGFDPLNEDADAFRLAVKLKLAIIPTGVAVNVSEIGGRSSIKITGVDPCAATRRAIVRAAAEIGRNNETKLG